MRDWIATLVGLIVLILGILVYVSPENFKVFIEFFPMTLTSIIVLALGGLLIVVGIISFICDRMSEK